jgi:hypothetical protein
VATNYDHPENFPRYGIGLEGVAEMGEACWTEYLEHPYHAVTCATLRTTSSEPSR